MSEVAIKTCKLNNEMDDKGKTDKFLEEACTYARDILFLKPCSDKAHQILNQSLSLKHLFYVFVLFSFCVLFYLLFTEISNLLFLEVSIALFFFSNYEAVRAPACRKTNRNRLIRACVYHYGASAFRRGKQFSILETPHLPMVLNDSDFVE